MNFSDDYDLSHLNDQQNKILIDNLKRKNEDLQQRLNISEKIRNDLQETLQRSNEQDHFFRSQQVRNFEERLNSANAAKSSIELELKTANSTIESLNNKILFIENSKRVQDQKILETSLKCFKRSFSSIDDLLTFMLIKPKYYEEESSKNEEMQAKLMKKIKKEKSKYKNLEAEIKKIQSNFDHQASEYEQKIVDLQNLNKELQNQIDLAADEADKAIISLQTKIITTRKPKLFFYREPPISILGKKPNPTVEESLKEKLKITKVYLKNFKDKNRKLEETVVILNNEIKLLKEQNEKIGNELKAAVILREESEKQLQTIRNTFETNKEDKLELKKKIKQQKQLINNQVESIQTQNKAINSLEAKLCNLNSQFSRVKREEKSSDSNHEFDSYDPTFLYRQNQVFQQISNCGHISYTECYSPELPSCIEPQIKAIIVNKSLQPASKIKMVLKTLCSFYEDQVQNLSQEKINIQNQLNKYVSCFTEFIPKFTALVLNRHASVNNFIDDPSMQDRALAVLRRKCENANEFPCIKTEANTLSEETQKLERKNKKYQKELYDLKEKIEVLKSSNNEKCSTILELQTQLKYLQRKYNEAQVNADKQKRDFLHKLESSKSQTEVEYEKIIDILKRKYCDQQNTISSLTAQLALHHG